MQRALLLIAAPLAVYDPINSAESKIAEFISKCYFAETPGKKKKKKESLFTLKPGPSPYTRARKNLAAPKKLCLDVPPSCFSSAVQGRCASTAALCSESTRTGIDGAEARERDPLEGRARKPKARPRYRRRTDPGLRSTR